MRKKFFIFLVTVCAVSSLSFGMHEEQCFAPSHRPNSPDDNWSGISEDPPGFVQPGPAYLPPMSPDADTAPQAFLEQQQPAWSVRKKCFIGGAIALASGVAIVAGRAYANYKKNLVEAAEIKQIICHVNDCWQDIVACAMRLDVHADGADLALLAAIRAYAQQQNFENLQLTQTFLCAQQIIDVLSKVQLQKEHFVTWGVYDQRIEHWLHALEIIRDFLQTNYRIEMLHERMVVDALRSIRR